MVAWSLDALAAGVPGGVVAVPPGHGAAAEDALAGAAPRFPLGFALVEGGATRSASVRNALAAGRGRRGLRPRRRQADGRPRLFTATWTLAALDDADAGDRPRA